VVDVDVDVGKMWTDAQAAQLLQVLGEDAELRAEILVARVAVLFELLLSAGARTAQKQLAAALVEVAGVASNHAPLRAAGVVNKLLQVFLSLHSPVARVQLAHTRCEIELMVRWGGRLASAAGDAGAAGACTVGDGDCAYAGTARS
jgi:hypothetical protein